MDFTISTYKDILVALIKQNYTFQTFDEFLNKAQDRGIILRHDVDLLPENSLVFAKIQAELGIKGTYYFRAVPESWDEKIILEISSLGHEIAYHYENLTTCQGNVELALQDFAKNLEKLRKLAPVSTICMHGSPLSKFDSKDLWKNKSYKDFGIIGEPYFDLDFNQVLYLTDTGRRWNGEKVSVRDRVESQFKFNIHSSKDLIFEIEKGNFPNQIMFTFHPQRWNDSVYLWLRELILQNVKNIIKRLIYVKKKTA